MLDGAGQLVEMRETAYDSEAMLQSLLASHPQLLSGDSSGTPDRKWLLVRREMAIRADGGSAGTWAVDHLLLDQDGVPTLVEVKKSTNSEIRRAIVGQMLDYAANAVAYWPVDKMRSAFETRCALENRNPESLILELTSDEKDADAFWEMVSLNLQAQKLRLIFVADAIPTELRRIIEFLNRQMSPVEVIGVEVRQFSNDTLRTLVPSTVGNSASSETRKGPSGVRRTDWTWEKYADELSISPDRIAVGRGLVEQLLEFIAETGVDWRVVARQGYNVVLNSQNRKVAIVDVYWRKAPRFAVRLTAHPSQLGLVSPYPGLLEDWDKTESEWGWNVPSLQAMPDIRAALSMTPELTFR